MESNSFTGMETAGQVITCKAAVLWGPREPLVIEEVEVEPPQRMEVRIRILFTSICHSDLGAWKGEHEAHRVYPRILGHEASGIVESVGDGVMDMKAGDHVIPIFTGECGECRCCKSDKTNLCERFRVNPSKTVMSDGRSRFSLVGGDGERRPVYHFINTSTFAEYTVLDSACVVKIDERAPLELMCLLSCGVSTGLGAAWNIAKMEEGSTAAIFGLGAVGLAVAQGARLRGASRIIGVDINPEKAEKGMEMGLTDFIDPSKYTKPVHEVIHEMSKGGVDYSFECAGNLDVFREAFTSTHDGGGLTVLLGIHTNPRLLPLHPMELHGRSILGCDFGGFKGKSQLPGLVDKCIEELRFFPCSCAAPVVARMKLRRDEAWLRCSAARDSWKLVISGDDIRGSQCLMCYDLRGITVFDVRWSSGQILCVARCGARAGCLMCCSISINI